MTIHAIQTGSVRIKTAQAQGQEHGLRRRIGMFVDPHWTEWLPTYALKRNDRGDELAAHA